MANGFSVGSGVGAGGCAANGVAGAWADAGAMGAAAKGFESTGALMNGFRGAGPAKGAGAGAAKGDVIPANGEVIMPVASGRGVGSAGGNWVLAMAAKGLFPSGAFACKTVNGEALTGAGAGRPAVLCGGSMTWRGSFGEIGV